MPNSLLLRSRGPFRADHLRPGDIYELSNGHPILCPPLSGRVGRAASLGAAVLTSDPADRDVGVQVGFVLAPETLRAPVLAVGEIPDEPGWAQGAPPLAVEYADTGQDETDLQTKIRELLAAGTRFIWVVRLPGPRRVEVHKPGEKLRIARPGEELQAPGILANPVPVEALYNRAAAREVIFRNLLQRQGYSSLEEVRAEGEVAGEARGEVQGLRRAILEVLTARGFAVDDALRSTLSRSDDLERLGSVLRQAATAPGLVEILTALEV